MALGSTWAGKTILSHFAGNANVEVSLWSLALRNTWAGEAIILHFGSGGSVEGEGIALDFGVGEELPGKGKAIFFNKEHIFSFIKKDRFTFTCARLLCAKCWGEFQGKPKERVASDQKWLRFAPAWLQR